MFVVGLMMTSLRNLETLFGFWSSKFFCASCYFTPRSQMGLSEDVVEFLDKEGHVTGRVDCSELPSLAFVLVSIFFFKYIDIFIKRRGSSAKSHNVQLNLISNSSFTKFKP